MALTSPSTLLTDIRGKAGSNVFRTVGGNTLIRKDFARYKSYPGYAAQQKSNFHQVIKLWQQNSAANNATWETLARTIKSTNNLFFNKKLNGYNLFLSFNLNLLRWSNAINLVAPLFANLVVGYMNNPYIVNIDGYLYLYPMTPPGGIVLIEIESALGVSPGKSTCGVFRIIDIFTYLPPDGILLNNYWINTFKRPITEGLRYFFNVRLINKFNGYAGPWYKLNVVK